MKIKCTSLSSVVRIPFVLVVVSDLWIDFYPFLGVPFILKAGKAMSSKKADIRIQFKDVPGDIFKCRFQRTKLKPSHRVRVYVFVLNTKNVSLL